ncbi:hypothetical protein [Anabaena azotica]|uniref:Type I restriction enzyme R protein N-terminal domain-containing protein n=1 Tax=Anabaena azotica FACHB-119 TaxID=947527 RepID=A0ABR8CXK8_9NOST|nr:hypothetical protein [Anabaena azotica]MBD2499674.1 hypothetical protein [Anabaena azotica FACHB-119]
MSISNENRNFIKWIQSFDYRLLKNKDDVEINFIVPMFRYLSYPDSCCANNKNSQHIESIRIYYSHNEALQQTAETSLIIAIYIEPNSHNFSEAIERARFYSTYLRPSFFLVTNGYHIKLFKYFIYHKEELIFDKSIDSLKNTTIAIDFYNNFNFYIVKNIDKSTANILKYTQYNLIEKSLRRYNLQEIVANSDFRPAIFREGDRLTVVKPKVVIECNLPKAFAEGNCQIQFSSVILRGLKVSLNHQSILGQLMTGINTRPEWGCRSFLKQLDDNAFEVNLGQTTVILSDLETADLCLCIDVICQEYKKAIIAFEDALETWDFEFTQFLGVRGVNLFSVDAKLWRLMHNFANEFNYVQGKSEWHLFQQEDISIRISRGIRDHAFVIPKPVNYLSILPNGTINIVYEINDVHLQSLEKGELQTWQQDIGPRGTWTAKYTQQWLLKQFIPKVIDYYSQKYTLSEEELLNNIVVKSNQRTPIIEIHDIKELIVYLQEIQSWLHGCKENILSTSLQSYYRALTNLVRNTDSSIEGMDYIIRNLSLIEVDNTKDNIKSDFQTWGFKDVIDYLDAQAGRINNYQYESSLNAVLITRVFIWIIEYGKISFSQPQLNAAKQALLPLWEQCRFEMRHVYPNR